MSGLRARRIGRISINRDDVESKDIDTWWYLLNFIPIRAEYLYHSFKIEMDGFSPLFDKIKMHEMIPEYQILIHTQEETVAISVERKSK